MAKVFCRCGMCQSKKRVDDFIIQDESSKIKRPDDFDMEVAERAGIDSNHFKMHIEAIPRNDKGLFAARDTFGEVEFIIKRSELRRFVESIRERFGWEI